MDPAGGDRRGHRAHAIGPLVASTGFHQPAVLAKLAATGQRDFDRFDSPPIEGSPEAIAGTLAGLAAEGVGHVQLVIDPSTPAGVDGLVPVLEALDRT